MYYGYRKCREQERESIEQCLSNYAPLDGFHDLREIATAIEKGIYNASIDRALQLEIPNYWREPLFVEQYQATGYKVKVHLDPDSDINVNQPEAVRYKLVRLIHGYVMTTTLRRLHHEGVAKLPLAILDRIIKYTPRVSPMSLGSMKPDQLNPDINRKLVDELNMRAAQQIVQKYSKMNTCGRCGQKKTTEYELQLRSGDEGGTLKITCVVCGHVWWKRS